MWNDTDTPIAYLISFRCYGTWLHGDDHGFIDRDHNLFGTSYNHADSRSYEEFNRDELKGKPVSLNPQQREVVAKAIYEVCVYKQWGLYAENVRTNHVHVVIGIGYGSSSRALNSLKSYSTKRMREAGLWNREHSPWSRRGSKRCLWNEKSVALATNYVINGQGGPLPEFD